MERVRGASLEIAWQELGAGDPAIVVVPQWFLSSRSMRLSPLVQTLASRHRMILYDRRGTGESGKPGPPYTTGRDAKDLGGLVDALDLTGFVILALGVRGGHVGLNYSGHFPNRVRALVCIGGTPRWAAGPEWPYGISQASWDVAFSMLEGQAQPPDLNAEGDLKEAMAADWNACGWEAALDILARTRDEDLRSWLPKVTPPSLVVHLANDPLVSFEVARWLAESLPNGHLELFQAPREVPLRAPEELASHIEEFLRLVAAASAG